MTTPSEPEASAVTLSHYVVVRDDLPRGLLAAQVVHAAGESTPAGPPPEGTHAVVLAAKSPEVLETVSARLTAAGVSHTRVVESDAPYAGVLMAIGIPPCPREEVRRFLSALPLLR